MYNRTLKYLLPLAALSFLFAGLLSSRADEAALKAVLQDQAERVQVVEKVKPSVVAVFAAGGKGGGSGVLVSKDGYALTNFHVVKPCGNTMQCGLADGVLYDAVLVGWDMVGDVALIKLLPKKAGDEFPCAVLGDSDKVREGQWALAMGNPFLLATDYTPTVTFGLVSGVHRYQYPAGTILEYTDCIQIDASINPGNSGGPLFNMAGELIGINGRGSFDKRGRVNSGVGYAISINQIKNFLGALKAGMNADHATLGAQVTTQTDDAGLGRMQVSAIIDDCDAARRGLDLYDELVSFDGRLITSVNHYKNVLGLYPRGWRVPLEYRREGKRKEILVRLMGAQRREVVEEGDEKNKRPAPKILPGVKLKPAAPSPASKFFEAKHGFVNYYFNRLERDRVLKAFQQHGDFSKVNGTWTLNGSIRLKQLNSESPIKIEITEEKLANDKTEPVVNLKIEAFPYSLKPLASGLDAIEYRQPGGSGGLLAALYMYQRLLTRGVEGMTEIHHEGDAPLYPPLLNGHDPEHWRDRRVMAETLKSRFGPYTVKWYFSPEDQKLLGFELWLVENEDPCEVYFSDYRAVDGRQVPHTIQVKHGDGYYGTITLRNIELAAK